MENGRSEGSREGRKQGAGFHMGGGGGGGGIGILTLRLLVSRSISEDLNSKPFLGEDQQIPLHGILIHHVPTSTTSTLPVPPPLGKFSYYFIILLGVCPTTGVLFRLSALCVMVYN